MPFSSSPITVKDASSADKALIAYNDGTNSAFAHPILDSAGALVNPATNEELAKIYQPKVAVSASFTRPANITAYAATDLVANNTTSGSVTPMSFAAARANDVAGQVIRGILHKSSNVTTNAMFRVHLFKASPSVSNGDNAAFSPTVATHYLGCLEGTCVLNAASGTAAILTPVYGSSIPFVPASGTQNIFGLLEARAAYVPTSEEVFTIDLEVL